MSARPAARPPARPRVQVPRFTPEQKARLHAAIDAILKHVRAAARALQRYAALLNGRRPDRPAWASPYGPAPRRRTA
jgi:hypothetical protein